MACRRLTEKTRPEAQTSFSGAQIGVHLSRHGVRQLRNRRFAPAY